MQNMKNAKEYYTPPPPGSYPAVVVAATPTMAKKSGSSMIELTIEIAEGQFKGESATDYLLTDGNAKGAGIAKRKFKSLGVNTDIDQPDEAICAQLNGMQVNCTFGNADQMSKDSNYTEPMRVVNEQGQTITVQKLTIDGYSRHGAVAGAQQGVGAVAVQGAPQGYQAQPQQFAPQGAPQQFAPQGQPQFQGAPQGQQFAPQMAPQGQPQFAPQGPNGMQPAYGGQPAQQFAQAPWAAAPGGTPGPQGR